MSDEITPAYVAQWKGWSRSTAWRWLRSLRKKHGDEVVRTRGRLIYTTRTWLAKVGEEVPPPALDLRTERRLRALEEAQANADKRADGLALELSELKRDFGMFANVRFRKPA